MKNTSKLQGALKNYGLPLFMAVVISILPLIEFWHTQTVYSGSDLQFHINRIHELVTGLNAGNVNLISLHSFNSVGSGVQYFYPNLTLIPAVIVFLLVHNSVTAYYVSLLIYGIITFLVAEYAFDKLLKDKWLSLFGAIIFSLAFYRVFSILGVSAFGEFIAMAWIPLVVLGYYRVINKAGWKTLWIAMVLMGYTHLLSLALTIVILLGVTVLRLIINHKKVFSEILDYVKAAAAFVLSFLAFLVPFVLLTKQNNIATPDATLHYDWANTFAGYYVSSFRLLSSRTLGFVFIILLVAAFFVWKYTSPKTRFVFWIALGLTFLASSDFPYFELVHTPVANLQFPYRFLPFAIALLTLSAIMGLKDIADKTGKRSIIKYVIIGLSLITVVTSVISIHKYKNQSNETFKLETGINGHLNYKPFAQYRVDNASFDKQFNNQFNTYGGFDYWTNTAAMHKSSITNHLVYGNGKVLPSKLTKEGNRLVYTVTNGDAKRIDLPFIKYNGIPYSVKVNGKVVNISTSKRDTIEVPVSTGTSVITVQPQLNKLFVAFFIISLLGSIALLFIKTKKQNSTL
ncbi:MAG: YfhO family protein [Lactobacillaceae bacterium]|jgi:hypothetical protein|nr:YfhO family protein [Lactobacillaceae bacterium]